MNYVNLHNNESSDQACRKVIPTRVSFSIFPVYMSLVGSYKCNRKQAGGFTGGQKGHLGITIPTAMGCHLSSLARVSNRQMKPGVRPTQGSDLTGIFWGGTSAAVRVFFVCCLLQARLVTALPRRAGWELSLWCFPSRQVSDWTLFAFPWEVLWLPSDMRKNWCVFPRAHR